MDAGVAVNAPGKLPERVGPRFGDKIDRPAKARRDDALIGSFASRSWPKSAAHDGFTHLGNRPVRKLRSATNMPITVTERDFKGISMRLLP
jgi:hypothetical protein